jgi:hypothetical protein
LCGSERRGEARERRNLVGVDSKNLCRIKTKKYDILVTSRLSIPGTSTSGSSDYQLKARKKRFW